MALISTFCSLGWNELIKDVAFFERVLLTNSWLWSLWKAVTLHIPPSCSLTCNAALEPHLLSETCFWGIFSFDWPLISSAASLIRPFWLSLFRSSLGLTLKKGIWLKSLCLRCVRSSYTNTKSNYVSVGVWKVICLHNTRELQPGSKLPFVDLKLHIHLLHVLLKSPLHMKMTHPPTDCIWLNWKMRSGP